MKFLITTAAFGCALLLSRSALGAEPLEILPLGDSITGTENVPGSYRTELADNLDSSGYQVSYDGSNIESPSSTDLTKIDMTQGHPGTDNDEHPGTSDEGHGGYTIAHIYYNLTSNDGDTGNNGGDWLNGGVSATYSDGTSRTTAIDPAFITLNIGTNDTYLPGETSADMLASLKTLLDYLKGDYVGQAPFSSLSVPVLTDTQVIISNLPPRNDGNTNAEALEMGYNAGIAKVVSDEDFANFHFLDINSTFTDDDPQDPNGDLSSDGVHPSAKGYDIMGDDFANDIKSIEAAPEPRTNGLFLLSLYVVLGLLRYSRKTPTLAR